MAPMKLVRGWALALALIGCGGSSAVSPVDGQAPDGGDARAGGGACGDHDGFPESLSVHTIGPPGGAPYDGPAVVERSTTNELVLAFSPTDASRPDGGAAGDLPLHAFIAASNLPVFPLGARVWLYKSAAGDQFNAFSAPPATTIAVRDKKGGHLILGAGYPPDGTALIPYAVSAGGQCTTAYSDECAKGTAVYSSLDVQGDSTVTIADNETRTVRAGGVDYDVTVMARKIDAKTINCTDYFTYDGVAMDVRAKAPAPLIAGLEAGAPIACARGNDVVQTVYSTFYAVSLGTSYDGKAFYVKRADIPGADCYQFSVEGVASETPPEKPFVEFCAPVGLFPEPTVGQEFWATLSSYDITALRGPNRGPLLLASVFASAPFDADTSTRAQQVLGVPVEARLGCVYAQPAGPGTMPEYLWEVALGATSPGIIKTDAHTVVTVAGQSYDAWMESDAGARLYFSLVAQK
jgi:hypothetical protein